MNRADGYKLMKRLLFVLIAAFALSLKSFAQTPPKMNARILLIPLDDRPPCLQFTVRMGLIGDAEIVTPPREMLGRFTEFGKSDEIINWLKAQDLKRFDAAIVALDMLTYGGLVASRVHGETTAADALRRMEILRDLKKRHPKMPLYVQSVIMRLAPTGTGANESYRAKLAEWAETSVEADAKSKTRTAKLEREIPAEALTDYKMARQRNLTVNLKAVEMVREKTVDYLILSQDDAKLRGIHVADRERLIGEIRRTNLTNAIAVQPGADEVSMLLLARAMNERFKFSPKIKAVYSSVELSNRAMPYEDRALRETVSFHIKATGAREVENERNADLLFYVYASRFEPGRAESFAAEIAEKIKQGKRIIVADVDPKGDVQGGDPKFTDELGNRNLYPELNGYASWNTAGNTIGTALPQGVIFALAQAKLLKLKDASNRIWTAQNWFTFHRVLDDYYYHTEVRAKAKDYIAQNKWSAMRLTDEATREVEKFSRKLMLASFNELSGIYFRGNKFGLQKNVACEKPSDLSFDLPWNRTFEAEISFQLQCLSRIEK
ncbi:MAG: DUF4127 family protein [Acidobacteriota bacterium]|nr:DUF4127 family protein [Acidobacteriota bacterium]